MDLGGEFGGLKGMTTRAQAGDDANRSAEHQTRRGGLPTRASPLMVTGRAEPLFQTIVGPRQIGDVITVEQSRPVALGHFDKMPQGRPKRSGFVGPATYAAQEATVAPTDRRAAMPPGMVQDACGLMNQSEARSYGRPSPCPV